MGAGSRWMGGTGGTGALALSGCVMVALYNRRIYFWSLSDVFF
jgi:hypothetical protein